MKKSIQKSQEKRNPMNLINGLAAAVVSGSVNSTCYWVHHQPVVPEEARKFRKF